MVEYGSIRINESPMCETIFESYSVQFQINELLIVFLASPSPLGSSFSHLPHYQMITGSKKRKQKKERKTIQIRKYAHHFDGSNV